MADANAGPDPVADAAAAASAAAAGDTKTPEQIAADAAAASAAKLPVVPDKYDLKLPEGSTVDAAVVERTAARARELGLGNEAAQKLLEQSVKDESERTTQHQSLIDSWKVGGTNFVKRDEQWRAASLADADIGGSPEKLAVSVEKAQLALNKYGPELKAYLDETGLGSHPAAIKFLATIGRQMSEGALVTGTPANGGPKSDAEVLYPNHYTDGKPKP